MDQYHHYNMRSENGEEETLKSAEAGLPHQLTVMRCIYYEISTTRNKVSSLKAI